MSAEEEEFMYEESISHNELIESLEGEDFDKSFSSFTTYAESESAQSSPKKTECGCF